MSRRSRDPIGVAIAFSFGILAASVLVAPLFPVDGLVVGDVTLDPVGAVLVVGALAVIVVPTATFALYQVFALLDR